MAHKTHTHTGNTNNYNGLQRTATGVTHPKILTNLTNDSLTQFHLCMLYRFKSTLTCV